MNKCIYLLMSGFLVLCLSLSFDMASEASQPVMHVSKRVKIKRPEKPVDVMAVEKLAAEETQPPETQLAQRDQNTSLLKETSSEPISSLVSEPVVEEISPEAKPIEPSAPVAAEQEGSSDVIGEKEALFGDHEKYYVTKGRIDPFAPFLHKPDPQAVDIRTQEIQRRAPRTPLERVALGQLKLTAVMRLTDDQLAMVEDNNGKGFIVKKGTYIGENGGRVSDIVENKVIVQETYNDVFGKTSVRQIELKLQKQPGE